MICKRCGAAVSNNQKFCMRCGAPIVRENPAPGYSDYSARQQNNKRSRKNRTLLIVLVAVLWTIVLGLAAFLIWQHVHNETPDEPEKASGSGENASETEPGDNSGENDGQESEDAPKSLDELVTNAVYNDSLSDGYGYGVIMIPQINLDSTEIDSINQEIYETYYTNEAANWTRSSPVGAIRYYKALKDDILSVVIEYSRPENEFKSYSVYNVSVSGKRSVSDSEVIANSPISDFNGTVRKAMESWFYNAYYDSVSVSDESACEWYNEQLDATRADENVKRSRPYFNENGALCATVQIYRLAVSTNWETVNLESFPYDPQYSAYKMYVRPAEYYEYMIYDSNTRYISESELTSFSEYECWLALDEIYARHGRIFKAADINAYFTSKTWYRGTIPGPEFDANLDSYLNEYEKQNIDTIAGYMKKKGWRG